MKKRFKGIDVIVTGDMNTPPGSAPIKALLAAGLVDTHEGCKEIGTFHGFSGRPGRSRIDMVLVSPPVDVIRSAIITDKNPETGRWPSDHFPVVARFQWTR
jgi:endonuclease/exonuclease/phosphatase family metal-dependent hydrolase